MTTRIKHGLLTKLTAMARQARCPLCGEKLGPLAGLDWDHETALALGGADDASNLRAVHRKCHRIKTSGNGSTTAGSDIGRIAKTKRIAGKKASRFRLPDIGNVEKEAAPVRKGPRIPSRPFNKTLTRRMSGEVRSRT